LLSKSFFGLSILPVDKIPREGSVGVAASKEDGLIQDDLEP